LRSTSNGGNDGIEIKFGSYGNTVRDNVIHDTNIGRQYPGIFVYGGGKGINIVEGNVIWNAGEGIQVVSDAVVRNNIIFDCSVTGITAAPHAAVPQIRNVKIVNNTIVNHPGGVRIRWNKASKMVFANNAVYCPGSMAIDASGIGNATFSTNYVEGRLAGVKIDNSCFYDGGSISMAFVMPNKKNYWPKPGSALINHANPDFAPKLDFNRTTRPAPTFRFQPKSQRSSRIRSRCRVDVGAYESEGQTKNLGWQVRAGFKTNH